MGLEVVEAEDGVQALRAVGSRQFDALVVDLYMPGHSGLEVVQAAQAKDPNLQAIILTGGATVESAIEALRSGVCDFLTKPLESLAVFEHSLRRALEHRELLEENARLFEEIQRLAVTDPLTGLFNRRKLTDALENEIERASRYRRPLSAIMIDLDGLKAINDTYGHPVGDRMLQEVARAIRSVVRKVDVATRIGGDEFFILLPEADLWHAARVANRVLECIRQIRVGEGGITASIGVAEWRAEVAQPEAFVAEVDQALYRAKGEGGSCVWAWNDADAANEATG